MALDNDTRGWIMTAMSGIACILGASIICVDLLIRRLPGQKHFRIQDSNPFLSSSLSLSFGVMLFSSLYSMLPSSKSSLIKAGFSPKTASWILIGCFLGGVVGIQIVSRVLHHYMPSHVVDCDHSHDEEDADDHHTNNEFIKDVHPPSRESPGLFPRGWQDGPSISDEFDYNGSQPINGVGGLDEGVYPSLNRRPSLPSRLSASVSRLVSGTKSHCDEDGQCFGFTDPCGAECFKNISARGGIRLGAPTHIHRKPGACRANSIATGVADHRLLKDVDEDAPLLSLQHERPQSQHGYQSVDTDLPMATDSNSLSSPSNRNCRSVGSMSSLHSHSNHSKTYDNPMSHSHHHHVPTNAFLSIGLQTSIAIALHKLPEGFITYATNHANPRLGFSVFLALFIHNITEGFAMALPLYLAINSRWKAMFWSSLLGGASQPLGAAMAALWFKLAGNVVREPGEGVYGAMFAVTAGIMASVALQLFSESLDLTHNRNLCMIFAFAGMGILGISSALTAG